MELRAITWNIYHGRDRAPDPALHTWRSRILRTTERGGSHAQVNRDLFEQFATVLEEADWDLALLQECPPRWAERLAAGCDAEPHLALTSRNLPAPLDRAQALAASLNPDLVASWEGGSNLTLVRGLRSPPAIAERRELLLARSPETRRMAFTRLAGGPCIANLHASTDRLAAEEEVRRAAATAAGWAGDAPLLLGGDLNLRPASSAALFSALEREHDLHGPTSISSIDHLLRRGMRTVEAPLPWPSKDRQVPDPTTDSSGPALPIRLSDHPPVEGCFAVEPAGD